MAVVTARQMLESGVHFGHQTRRWNPKMKRFIFTERNGIYIIDLNQSLDYINQAYEFVRETVAHGGTILFVGTKKQAQEAVEQQATRVGMPYVNHRWLGGMLTNFATIHKRLQRLTELEQMDFDNPSASGLTKRELLSRRREKDKLERALGGIRTMAKVPSAVWIVDTNKEHIAVGEARKLGIPVVAVLDTNCDPDLVDYPVPGNDDAIRAVGLLTKVIADAVAEGMQARYASEAEAEPVAEWEAEILATGLAAAAVEGEAIAAAADAVATVEALEEVIEVLEAAEEGADPAQVVELEAAIADAEALEVEVLAEAIEDVAVAAVADAVVAVAAEAVAEAEAERTDEG